MADSKAEPAAAAGRANSVHAQDPEPVPPQAPCGCEERLDGQSERLGVLEGRSAAQDALNKAMSWCLLACAAAVLYLVWTSAGAGPKDAAK